MKRKHRSGDPLAAVAEYGGEFRIILIDDNSSDGTADLAGHAPNFGSSPWSRNHRVVGKLWALGQGVAASTAPVLLFTDADISMTCAPVSLVAKLTASAPDWSAKWSAELPQLAERMLVPAFVYFFQMLYPFNRVNDPRSRVARRPAARC